MINKVIKVGAILESEVNVTEKELKENCILRFFSKNDHSDILVTGAYLKENNINKYDANVYEKIKKTMGQYI